MDQRSEPYAALALPHGCRSRCESTQPVQSKTQPGAAARGKGRCRDIARGPSSGKSERNRPLQQAEGLSSVSAMTIALKPAALMAFLVVAGTASAARADDIGCLSTPFRILGANVHVSASVR